MNKKKMFKTTNQIMYLNVVGDLGNDLGLHFFKGSVFCFPYMVVQVGSVEMSIPEQTLEPRKRKRVTIRNQTHYQMLQVIIQIYVTLVSRESKYNKHK